MFKNSIYILQSGYKSVGFELGALRLCMSVFSTRLCLAGSDCVNGDFKSFLGGSFVVFFACGVKCVKYVAGSLNLISSLAVIPQMCLRCLTL